LAYVVHDRAERVDLAMQYVFVVVVVVMFTVIFGKEWLKRRQEAPLRREVRAQEIIFRTRLYDVKEKKSQEWLTAMYGEIYLIVRAEAFEISCIIPPIRVVLGLEYYFRARETTIEVTRLPGIPKREWIVVTGRQLGKEIRLAIAQTRDLRDAWNALVAAGAVPVGLPPQRREVSGFRWP
jgi:hypothetical protein